MPYGASIEKLVEELYRKAPAKADALAVTRRICQHGLLSVGLKIHCLNDRGNFNALIQALGGSRQVLNTNRYRKNKASWCLVLPPVGNAESLITLVECLEIYTGVNIFGNPDFQLQLCSPGRLDNRRSALLAIAFYLGSDTFRRYAMSELTTTVSHDISYNRGQRLVIYDAGWENGEFDGSFMWWKREVNDILHVHTPLPLRPERTDLLIDTASPADIFNVNLVATLLVHAQFVDKYGWWQKLGLEFEQDLENLLHEHHLSGILDAQWVTPLGSRDASKDDAFRAALNELVSVALLEMMRIERHITMLELLKHSVDPITSGIFDDIETLLERYRVKVTQTEGGKSR